MIVDPRSSQQLSPRSRTVMCRGSSTMRSAVAGRCRSCVASCLSPPYPARAIRPQRLSIRRRYLRLQRALQSALARAPVSQQLRLRARRRRGPACLPVGSATTRPSGVRTTRTSSRLFVVVPQPTQVRCGTGRVRTSARRSRLLRRRPCARVLELQHRVEVLVLFHDCEAAGRFVRRLLRRLAFFRLWPLVPSCAFFAFFGPACAGAGARSSANRIRGRRLRRLRLDGSRFCHRRGHFHRRFRSSQLPPPTSIPRLGRLGALRVGLFPGGLRRALGPCRRLGRWCRRCAGQLLRPSPTPA